MDSLISAPASSRAAPWNKGKLVGQKSPLRLKDIWAIRVRLQLQRRTRELALLNLGLDSKLRACDLVALRVRDICHGERVASRAIVVQQKTGRPVQFEITASTRDSVQAWIGETQLNRATSCFPAAVTGRITWGHANTRESFTGGSRRSALMYRTSGHTPSDVRKRP